jgi:ribosomal protein L17
VELRERAKILLVAAESVKDAEIADELRNMAKELLTVAKDIELFERRIALARPKKTIPIHLPAPTLGEPKH